MYQRFLQFVPSILTIAMIGIAAVLVCKKLAKHWKLEEWSVVEFRENLAKRVILAFLLGNVFAPFTEELVFRGPLVIFFGSLTGNAWVAILTSAALFAALHLTNPALILPEEIIKKENDNLVDAIKEAREELPVWRKSVQKILQVAATFAMGTLSGYLAILKQSVWIAVAVHFAWNLIGGFILGLIVIVVIYIGYGIYHLFQVICNRIGLPAVQASVFSNLGKRSNNSKKPDK
jgi:membrane protease YdiL (CAAX protease family)